MFCMPKVVSDMSLKLTEPNRTNSRFGIHAEWKSKFNQLRSISKLQSKLQDSSSPSSLDLSQIERDPKQEQNESAQY